MSYGKLNRVKDVAATLALHPIHVYNMIKNKEINATRIGRAVRVSDAELERFISTHTAESK